MKAKKIKTFGTVGVLLLLGVVLAALMTNNKHVELNTTTVSTGTLDITVLATGYVQPVEEVEVGTQVSGVIEKIYVDYNSQVKKGQLLAELDKLTLQEKLNQANAQLTSAQSDYNYAKQNYDRVKKLHDAKAATDVSYEDAVNRLAQAKTTVDNAKANLNQAQVNLSYASIYSPIDGVVLERAVNTGQTVAASFNTPTLFRIAEDLTKMQVEVDVDEADIGQVRVGQKVNFTVDAYPNDVFEGTVSQIRIQPTVTSNVVTYTVIVDAPNPEEKLFPGMTASITIEVQAEDGILVPVEAVNFRMSPDLMAELGVNPADAELDNRNSQYVWVKEGNKAVPRQLQTSMNDGINYIAKSGVSPGEEVILSASLGKKTGKNSTPTSIMPSPPKGGGRPR